jgi:hypothetical protein
MMMKNTLLLLAGTFFLVRLLSNVPVSSRSNHNSS